MHRNYPFAFMFLFVASLTSVLSAESPEDAIKRGKLIFSDDFNRSEADESKEDLGNNWQTNTASQPVSGKQADLQNNSLVITMGEGANHSVSVRHDNPFDDGVVKLRFQLFDRHGLKLNFNDKSANKVTWAGHIARVVVQPKSITIQDDKTGVFDLGVREKRQNKDLNKKEKAELAKFLATKRKVIKTSLDLEKWYELTVVNIGPKFEVYIDGKPVGSFSSEGLNHQVKQNVAFGVSGKVAVDDLHVWSLD